MSEEIKEMEIFEGISIGDVSASAETPSLSEPIPEESPPKPKRVRKKKEEPAGDIPETPEEAAEKPDEPAPATADESVEEPAAEVLQKTPPTTILTLEARAEVNTAEDIADTVWHEIQNALRTRRMLTGILGGLEQIEDGKTVAVVDYKGFRVVIPMREMVMDFPNHATGREYQDALIRYHKLLTRMLGCELDFIVKGIDDKTRSIVASRRDALLKKRQIFYLDPDENGNPRIYEGRIVQARVVAVIEKAIRVEIFGIEHSINARDLAWEWIGDARDRFSVGDRILTRILRIYHDSLESMGVKADVKSLSAKPDHHLERCRIQSKYVGKVTDVHKGVVFIRLSNGVNAVAHSCMDRRAPGKKDDVAFVVTHIDEEQGVALGIITRVIKQHI